MKKIKTFLLIGVAVLALIQPVSAASVREGLTPVRDSKHKNLFVFKTDRKFVGAKVEIIASNGDVVSAQTLEKKKMIIDFCDVKKGSYTIRVSKGSNVKEFRYDKK